MSFAEDHDDTIESDYKPGIAQICVSNEIIKVLDSQQTTENKKMT